ELAHAELNRCWFGGTLRPIPIHLSHRMRSRLGEWRAHQRDLPEEIVISARHIERQGWTAALDTLLHEMIHQWQAATDRPVKHDAEFRRRAKAVGISPRAKF
ncbi:MAG: SprT-like domain-containing protein, partial [Gemmatimonadales bacterium]